MPVVLAHGALGPFDEILFIGVTVVFLILMGISWMKSRSINPDEDDIYLESPESNEPDRYRLD